MSRRRKILIIVGAALAAAVFIPIIHYYQLRAATEAYIAELKAGGEPMDLAQVIPPPVPPEQNSADTFRDAAALFETDQSLLTTNSYSAMKMVAPGKAMICWQQSDARGYDATNSWEDVTAAVAQNAKAFALLQQIIEKPNFDFQIQYEQGVADLNFTNLYLAESKRAALRLSVAALCNLHQGNTASGVKNLRAMLALVKTMRDERLVISELVRIAIAQIALAVNWEVLQSPNLTDEQLAKLQHDWIGLEFIQAQENALAMERATGEITLAKWRKSNTELQCYFSLGKKARESMGFPDDEETLLLKAKTTAKIFMWRYWWSYPDETRTLKGYEVLLQTARSAGTIFSLLAAMNEQKTQLESMGLDKVSDEFGWFFDPATDMHSMLSQSIVSLARVFSKVMTVEAAKQMTITAIALKRYQLKYGYFPADLTSLVPEFFSEVPRDPVDGQPLRYRRNADGRFLLYSIGEDGKDDNGDAKRANSNSQLLYWQYGLDWVWPQPATPEEIQKYYDEQARKSE